MTKIPIRCCIRRDVYSNGRSRCRINGHPVTVAQLAAVGELLVDIHGQHDHQSLLRPRNQLELLDAYGGSDLMALEGEFARTWRRLNASRAELAQLLDSERERARRIDLLRFQLGEIDGAGLRVDEEEELEIRRRRLQNLVRLQGETGRVYAALHEGADGVPAASDVLAEGTETIRALAELDPELEEAAACWTRLPCKCRRRPDCCGATQISWKRTRMSWRKCTQRLAVISELKRKYGATVAEVLAFADQLRRELQRCWSTVKAARNELYEEMSELDERRAARWRSAVGAGSKRSLLEEAVSAELEGLHMGPGRFVVSWSA